MLIGENFEKLEHSHVVVVGVGGVGGATLEMLARAGVGEFTIIDFDKIDETNINRQLIAFTDSIDKIKVDEWKNKIKRINPNCVVNNICEKVNEFNVGSIIPKNCDIVVDAIDMVTSKIALIKYCKDNDIEIISAMGAGNRLDRPIFEPMDIYKTQGDGLAKILRKKLKELGIKNHTVVCAKTQTITPITGYDAKIGSISYYPVMAGCVICQVVIFKLLNK